MSESEDSTPVPTKEFEFDRELLNHYNDAVFAVKGISPQDQSTPITQSQTITIQLEEDLEYYMKNPRAADELDPEITDFYDPPPKTADVCPRVAKNVCVRHLSPMARRQFEIFLDPSCMGTRYNWEYLAARLGLSSSEILHMKMQKYPTSEVLMRFSNRSLEELLKIICDLGRIDLLIALRGYIDENNPVLSDFEKSPDSGIVESAASYTPASASTSTGENDNGNKLFRLLESDPKRKYILIVHHEEATNHDQKKRFGWLMKNLRKYADRADIVLFDLNDCLDDSNLCSTINKIFTRAVHVIFVFTKEFYELINGPFDDRSMKKFIYDMSTGEYARSLRNTRFRPVIFKGCDNSVLPVGWPTNTIIYEFPTNFGKLCERIFK